MLFKEPIKGEKKVLQLEENSKPFQNLEKKNIGTLTSTHSHWNHHIHDIRHIRRVQFAEFAALRCYIAHLIRSICKGSSSCLSHQPLLEFLRVLPCTPASTHLDIGTTHSPSWKEGFD